LYFDGTCAASVLSAPPEEEPDDEDFEFDDDEPDDDLLDPPQPVTAKRPARHRAMTHLDGDLDTE
jgi:hypothetical protein